MEITGKLHFVGEAVSKSDKFTFREIVLEVTDPKGQYTTHPVFQLSGNKLDIANGLVGQQVKVDFDIQGRAWNDPKTNQTKYFNTLVAWRVTSLQAQAQGFAPQQYAQPQPQAQGYAIPPQVQHMAQQLGAQTYVPTQGQAPLPF